ncbi:Gfo/Idh/MocA family protein [Truepera radiovictrix]|uniref:Oxidoreductase domain protein n=1 Tax=Truepera radiovictrix (strain DSM 17093 / CIP 108686 / LMG 22925 / RQ-24) TaxID=649638 RepID=D7CTE6_TRURR|nr:Gfo/Idh/MocA family oxidoreductase [Truepera radiovictrix]ADI13803.1 oxidoreductase domain protein [Truepera radiovictrix DSM 17093]WMT57632.1 Gfo/Idh/MocA family oxidoreductase [Truepera radiovictrix]
MTARVRWGIIGVGNVTERKSGPGFQRAARSELVAVMRRDAARAADYARRHGVPRWYADAGALIHDPEVDAVYIATPPDSHMRYTLEVAAAGKPVYVEKPMARTAAECEAMVAACRAAGVPLFVAYYRRAMPRFVKVKALLEGGAVGEPRAVVVRLQQNFAPEPGAALPWRVRPEVSGGGLFVDLGSHVLDLLDWLFGPIVEVTGAAANQAGRYPAEDLVTATFRFASGVRGVGLWCFSAALSTDEVEVVGSAGSLRFATFNGQPLKLTTAAGTEEIPAPYPETVQLPLIQTVVDALTGRGMCPSTGESALRTARVIDALLEAHRRGST